MLLRGIDRGNNKIGGCWIERFSDVQDLAPARVSNRGQYLRKGKSVQWNRISKEKNIILKTRWVLAVKMKVSVMESALCSTSSYSTRTCQWSKFILPAYLHICELLILTIWNGGGADGSMWARCSCLCTEKYTIKIAPSQ